MKIRVRREKVKRELEGVKKVIMLKVKRKWREEKERIPRK